MLLAVLSGYIVAAAFAFCGVYQLAEGVGSLTPESGYSSLMHTIPATAWPLAVACVVYTLTQIAVQVERNAIFSKIAASGSTKNQPLHLSGREDTHTQPTQETGDDSRYFRLDSPPPTEKASTKEPPQELSDRHPQNTPQEHEEFKFFRLH